MASAGPTTRGLPQTHLITVPCAGIFSTKYAQNRDLLASTDMPPKRNSIRKKLSSSTIAAGTSRKKRLIRITEVEMYVYVLCRKIVGFKEIGEKTHARMGV